LVIGTGFFYYLNARRKNLPLNPSTKIKPPKDIPHVTYHRRHLKKRRKNSGSYTQGKFGPKGRRPGRGIELGCGRGGGGKKVIPPSNLTKRGKQFMGTKGGLGKGLAPPTSFAKIGKHQDLSNF